MTPDALEPLTVKLDLPPLVVAFGRHLHAAGVPVTAGGNAAFARALTLVGPLSRDRLYHTAKSVLLTDHSQAHAFDAVFAAVFGGPLATEDDLVAAPTQPADASAATSQHERRRRAEPDPGAHAFPPPARDREPRQAEVDSGGRESHIDTGDAEVLRQRRFDELAPDELAAVRALMARMRIELPVRQTRRTRRYGRGDRMDMRRTLRRSLRTAGDPVQLERRQRRERRRRLVLLCDISGSMELYARAYLNFLACAAGADRHTEAFAFATRLTRLTRALRTRDPDQALQRAKAVAPDWSGGTRLGEALKAFNDRHGRRGMARGAVIVILSDGWELGDPALVGREIERLARLAYRIVWVNPRAAASGFVPLAGGMAAALPYIDALVSGETLQALTDVVRAIAADRTGRPPAPGGR